MANRWWGWDALSLGEAITNADPVDHVIPACRDLVRALRESEGFSMAVAAQALGVGASTYERFERHGTTRLPTSPRFLQYIGLLLQCAAVASPTLYWAVRPAFVNEREERRAA